MRACHYAAAQERRYSSFYTLLGEGRICCAFAGWHGINAGNAPAIRELPLRRFAHNASQGAMQHAHQEGMRGRPFRLGTAPMAMGVAHAG